MRSPPGYDPRLPPASAAPRPDRTTILASTCPDRHSSSRTWPGLAGERADRVGKFSPQGTAVGEVGGAATGYGIDPPSPPGGRHLPAALQQLHLFETVQNRVHRTLGQVEGAAAARPDPLDDGVAMRRTRLDRGEHDHVEMTFENFAFHT